MAITVVHASQTGAAANPNVLVDGPKWDAEHVVTGTSDAIDIFLVIGDSNAVGQGTTGPSGIFEQALMYCADGTLQTVSDPTRSAVDASRNANTGSMWPAFAIAYGRKVGLVLTGKSGSTQVAAADLGSGNWDTTGTLYAESLVALNAALVAFTNAGYAPTLRGIIYILGNNDASEVNATHIVAAEYSLALAAMLGNYRITLIGGKTHEHLTVYMPIIGTNISQSDYGYAQIRGAQQAYAATDGNVVVPFVDMLSFSVRGLINSGTHPTQAGYNIMGAAIGAAAIPAVSAIKPYDLVSANTAIGPAPPSKTVRHSVGQDGFTSPNVIDSYGAHGQSEIRRANGTALAPTAVLNGNIIGNRLVKGYGTTGFPTAASGALLWVATEDHTDTAHGSKMQGYVTANGSATPQVAIEVTASGIGYPVGAGGAVTQATSRTTGVTLNKAAGAITLVSAAGSTAPATFTVTNSTVAATDTILVSQKSGADIYWTLVNNVSAGSFQITLFTTGGTTVEQPVFNFAVIKSAAS